MPTTATSHDPLVNPVHDPDFLRAAMDWHFSPETGSPFWLSRARLLDFDPRTDVTSFEDLLRFPNVANDLRTVQLRDLIPKGCRDSKIVGVFESGGTTGPPKRVVVLQEWYDLLTDWLTAVLDACDVPYGRNWLALVPGGPHMVGDLWRGVAARRGGLWFPIDLDPRWVKKLVSERRYEDVAAYTEHLFTQAETFLGVQDVGVIMTTPPMLERMAQRPKFMAAMEGQVESIQWGGAHMDPDSRSVLANDVFPKVRLSGGYANTMALGAGGVERPGLQPGDPCIFDSFAPFVSFAVVDPGTGQRVDHGQRGQVIVNHVSKWFLLPNNLERDMATRIESPVGHMGDSIADVAPVEEFEGQEVIEGVY